ncbi:MAG: cytochrome c oxidase subunit 3 [Saprospiraceae bacterium]|jgi:cytochrome c oxidase subunit 3|nr:cytochrome c oxidase subunit 3 [Saprospiraceae bacterium]MBK7467237.1 cytochrome c oxidase subunit 3 [Saprospiraceae bacterium]
MAFVQMVDKNLPPSRYQAVKFGMWIAMVSITMMFGAFTSAYLVRKPVGNWYEFKLPVEFFYSTLILIASSFLMEWAYRSYKQQEEKSYKVGIFLTLLLGIGFIIAQVIAWKALVAQGITIDLNVSGSFLYVLSGFHALHVLGGIGALFVSNFVAFGDRYELTMLRTLRLDLVRQYWHFVDILWIYLLVFLMLQ